LAEFANLISPALAVFEASLKSPLDLNIWNFRWLLRVGDRHGKAQKTIAAEHGVSRSYVGRRQGALYAGVWGRVNEFLEAGFP
jgi:hypothetical protein